MLVNGPVRENGLVQRTLPVILEAELTHRLEVRNASPTGPRVRASNLDPSTNTIGESERPVVASYSGRS